MVGLRRRFDIRPVDSLLAAVHVSQFETVAAKDSWPHGAVFREYAAAQGYRIGKAVCTHQQEVNVRPEPEIFGLYPIRASEGGSRVLLKSGCAGIFRVGGRIAKNKPFVQHKFVGTSLVRKAGYRKHNRTKQGYRLMAQLQKFNREIQKAGIHFNGNAMAPYQLAFERFYRGFA